MGEIPYAHPNVPTHTSQMWVHREDWVVNTDEETHECVALPWPCCREGPTEILQLFSPLRRQETARKRPAEPYPMWLSPPLPALKHYLIRGPSGLTSWFFSLLGCTELDIPPSTTSTSHSKLPTESKPCTHTHTCTHTHAHTSCHR